MAIANLLPNDWKCAKQAVGLIRKTTAVSKIIFSGVGIGLSSN
jgi:hypothetical protein